MLTSRNLPLVHNDQFAELTEALKRFPEVETHCYPGVAEAYAKTIADRISMRAFWFVVIDPKGIPMSARSNV